MSTSNKKQQQQTQGRKEVKANGNHVAQNTEAAENKGDRTRMTVIENQLGMTYKNLLDSISLIFPSSVEEARMDVRAKTEYLEWFVTLLNGLYSHMSAHVNSKSSALDPETMISIACNYFLINFDRTLSPKWRDKFEKDKIESYGRITYELGESIAEGTFMSIFGPTPEILRLVSNIVINSNPCVNSFTTLNLKIDKIDSHNMLINGFHKSISDIVWNSITTKKMIGYAEINKESDEDEDMYNRLGSSLSDILRVIKERHNSSLSGATDKKSLPLLRFSFQSAIIMSMIMNGIYLWRYMLKPENFPIVVRLFLNPRKNVYASSRSKSKDEESSSESNGKIRRTSAKHNMVCWTSSPTIIIENNEQLRDATENPVETMISNDQHIAMFRSQINEMCNEAAQFISCSLIVTASFPFCLRKEPGEDNNHQKIVKMGNFVRSVSYIVDMIQNCSKIINGADDIEEVSGFKLEAEAAIAAAADAPEKDKEAIAKEMSLSSSTKRFRMFCKMFSGLVAASISKPDMIKEMSDITDHKQFFKRFEILIKAGGESDKITDVKSQAFGELHDSLNKMFSPILALPQNNVVQSYVKKRFQQFRDKNREKTKEISSKKRKHSETTTRKKSKKSKTMFEDTDEEDAEQPESEEDEPKEPEEDDNEHENPSQTGDALHSYLFWLLGLISAASASQTKQNKTNNTE